jgi:hypothetical protein
MKRLARTATGSLSFQSLRSQFVFQSHRSPFQYRYRTYRLPSELRLRMTCHPCYHLLNTQIGCIVFASETRRAPHTKYLHFFEVSGLKKGTSTFLGGLPLRKIGRVHPPCATVIANVHSVRILASVAGGRNRPHTHLSPHTTIPDKTRPRFFRSRAVRAKVSRA